MIYMNSRGNISPGKWEIDGSRCITDGNDDEKDMFETSPARADRITF